MRSYPTQTGWWQIATAIILFIVIGLALIPLQF